MSDVKTLANIKRYGEGYYEAVKTIALSGAAVPVTETLFTVTGEVEAIVIGYIDTSVTSPGGTLTLEVGVAGDTTGLIVQTATAGLLANLLWVDAVPSVLESKPTAKIIANSLDIVHTIRTDTVDTGKITYYCFWKPLSGDGDVVSA